MHYKSSVLALRAAVLGSALSCGTVLGATDLRADTAFSRVSLDGAGRLPIDCKSMLRPSLYAELRGNERALMQGLLLQTVTPSNGVGVSENARWGVDRLIAMGLPKPEISERLRSLFQSLEKTLKDHSRRQAASSSRSDRDAHGSAFESKYAHLLALASTIPTAPTDPKLGRVLERTLNIAAILQDHRALADLSRAGFAAGYIDLVHPYASGDLAWRIGVRALGRFFEAVQDADQKTEVARSYARIALEKLEKAADSEGSEVRPLIIEILANFARQLDTPKFIYQILNRRQMHVRQKNPMHNDPLTEITLRAWATAIRVSKKAPQPDENFLLHATADLWEVCHRAISDHVRPEFGSEVARALSDVTLSVRDTVVLRGYVRHFVERAEADGETRRDEFYDRAIDFLVLIGDDAGVRKIESKQQKNRSTPPSVGLPTSEFPEEREAREVVESASRIEPTSVERLKKTAVELALRADPRAAFYLLLSSKLRQTMN